MDSRINFQVIRSKYQEENEMEKWVKLITEFKKGGWTSVEKVFRDLNVQIWTKSHQWLYVHLSKRELQYLIVLI